MTDATPRPLVERLRKHRVRGYADTVAMNEAADAIDQLVAALQEASNTLGFLRSVVLSGEDYTTTAEDRYDWTQAKILDALAAAQEGE